MGWTGFLSYLVPIVRAFFSFQPPTIDRFAPEADPADGRLRGTHTRMREVTMFRTHPVTFRSADGPFAVHLDGELREAPLGECTVTVEPGCLSVLA